jgi:MFS family permease
VTRALSSRNYRLFTAGQIISLSGSWMQRIAVMWLVYRLTDSETALGAIAFLSQAPTLLLSSFAGVLADKFSKHRMLIAMQLVDMMLAAVLAFLTLSGLVEVWHLYVLALLSGISTSFEVPIRQSFVIEMLDDRADLPAAIALNSTIFNGARLIGPAIAGLVIMFLGEGACFLINTFSYFGVLSGLLAMRLPPRAVAPQREPFWQNWIAGFRYAWGRSSIRTCLLIVITVSLTVMPYITLLPAFARFLSHERLTPAGVNGILNSAVGLGAVVGALALALRGSKPGLARVAFSVLVGFGAILLCFSLSRTLWLSLALLTAAGYCMMTLFASMNTIVQSLVTDEWRGRVLSHYVVAFIGIGPFGSFLAGWLAERLGAPLVIGGGSTILLILAWMYRAPLRRIDAQLARIGK